jgi:uncharacterized ion transporter superfamily protein YfcC
MDGNPGPVQTPPPQAPPADQPTPEQPAGEAPSPQTKWFPSAFTVIAIVLFGVWLLTFVIPAGRYDVNDEGAPIPGTYEEIPAPLDFGERVKDFFSAPINGLYGIEDSETGFVDPDASGLLYGSAGVFLFVLAIGMFITVMFATGALDRGIARLAYAVRGRGWLLIVAIMSVFSLLGTVEGFAEETLGFYGLVVPLMLALGYDRMVAVGVIIVGAGVGVMGSTVNPFSIGIASGFADVSIGDGIALRFAMWITFTVVAMAYVLRYAQRIKAQPEASLVGFAPGDREQAVAATTTEPAPLTGLHERAEVASQRGRQAPGRRAHRIGRRLARAQGTRPSGAGRARPRGRNGLARADRAESVLDRRLVAAASRRMAAGWQQCPR